MVKKKRTLTININKYILSRNKETIIPRNKKEYN